MSLSLCDVLLHATVVSQIALYDLDSILVPPPSHIPIIVLIMSGCSVVSYICYAQQCRANCSFCFD